MRLTRVWWVLALAWLGLAVLALVLHLDPAFIMGGVIMSHLSFDRFERESR